MRDSGAVVVEFFGPFRKYGSSMVLPLREEMGLNHLCERLESLLGEGFIEKQAREDAIRIVNNRVVEHGRGRDVLIRPGDRVAFALALGGG